MTSDDQQLPQPQQQPQPQPTASQIVPGQASPSPSPSQQNNSQAPKDHGFLWRLDERLLCRVVHAPAASTPIEELLTLLNTTLPHIYTTWEHSEHINAVVCSENNTKLTSLECDLTNTSPIHSLLARLSSLIQPASFLESKYNPLLQTMMTWPSLYAKQDSTSTATSTADHLSPPEQNQYLSKFTPDEWNELWIWFCQLKDMNEDMLVKSCFYQLKKSLNKGGTFIREECMKSGIRIKVLRLKLSEAQLHITLLLECLRLHRLTSVPLPALKNITSDNRMDSKNNNNGMMAGIGSFPMMFKSSEPSSSNGKRQKKYTLNDLKEKPSKEQDHPKNTIEAYSTAISTLVSRLCIWENFYRIAVDSHGQNEGKSSELMAFFNEILVEFYATTCSDILKPLFLKAGIGFPQTGQTLSTNTVSNTASSSSTSSSTLNSTAPALSPYSSKIANLSFKRGVGIGGTKLTTTTTQSSTTSASKTMGSSSLNSHSTLTKLTSTSSSSLLSNQKLRVGSIGPSGRKLPDFLKKRCVSMADVTVKNGVGSSSQGKEKEKLRRSKSSNHVLSSDISRARADTRGLSRRSSSSNYQGLVGHETSLKDMSRPSRVNETIEDGKKLGKEKDKFEKARALMDARMNGPGVRSNKSGSDVVPKNCGKGVGMDEKEKLKKSLELTKRLRGSGNFLGIYPVSREETKPTLPTIQTNENTADSSLIKTPVKQTPSSLSSTMNIASTPPSTRTRKTRGLLFPDNPSSTTTSTHASTPNISRLIPPPTASKLISTFSDVNWADVLSTNNNNQSNVAKTPGRCSTGIKGMGDGDEGSNPFGPYNPIMLFDSPIKDAANEPLERVKIRSARKRKAVKELDLFQLI